MNGGGWDLHHPRPWLAEPMSACNPSGPWQVSCPSKAGPAAPRDLVATWLSEVNAKEIAAAPNTEPRTVA